MDIHLQLIQGEFSSNEALDLISQLIQVKIKFHENRIAGNGSEEDLKYRESKIKRLQQELSELRTSINNADGNVRLDGKIKIEV